MSDLSDTIKGFYSDFILRDLLSFVTPGAIVVGTLIFAMPNLITISPYGYPDFLFVINHLPIFIWILLFGLFYVVGLGIQFAGLKISTFTMQKDWLDLLFPPKKYTNQFRKGDGHSKECKQELYQSEEEIEIPFGLEDKSRNAKYYHCLRLPFLTHSNATEKKIHERFIVLMQTSGNIATAFFISFSIGVIVSIFFPSSDSQISQFWVFFSLLCVVISILFYNIFHNLRQKLLDWEYEVNNFFR